MHSIIGAFRRRGFSLAVHLFALLRSSLKASSLPFSVLRCTIQHLTLGLRVSQVRVKRIGKLRSSVSFTPAYRFHSSCHLFPPTSSFPYCHPCTDNLFCSSQNLSCSWLIA